MSGAAAVFVVLAVCAALGVRGWTEYRKSRIRRRARQMGIHDFDELDR